MFLSDISHTGGFLIFESLKKKNLKGAGALNRMNMVCKKTMKKVFLKKIGIYNSHSKIRPCVKFVLSSSFVTRF